MGASKSGKGFGEMNWFGKYVVERNGLVHWDEGMLVTDEPLRKACENDPLVAFIIGTSSVFGVVVGQA